MLVWLTLSRGRKVANALILVLHILCLDGKESTFPPQGIDARQRGVVPLLFLPLSRLCLSKVPWEVDTVFFLEIM